MASFDNFLDQLVKIESENWETSAYIKSTMRKYIRADNGMPNKSVVLMWYDARQTGSFRKFQDIGDWVFFTRTWFPGSIKCDLEFYESVGRSSYYKCYRYMKGTWPVYEELADNFHEFVQQLNESLQLEPL